MQEYKRRHRLSVPLLRRCFAFFLVNTEPPVAPSPHPAIAKHPWSGVSVTPDLSNACFCFAPPYGCRIRRKD